MLIDADWMSNVPMFQCSNVKKFKCSNVQMIKYSNIKCQMSIRLNFCWSVPPEFLRSFLSFISNILLSVVHILIIKVKGLQVAPAELEDCLRSLDGVGFSEKCLHIP